MTGVVSSQVLLAGVSGGFSRGSPVLNRSRCTEQWPSVKNMYDSMFTTLTKTLQTFYLTEICDS